MAQENAATLDLQNGGVENESTKTVSYKAADAVLFYKTAFGAGEFKRVMYPKRKEEQVANSRRGRSSCSATWYRGKQKTKAWILRLPSLRPDQRLLCSGWLWNKLDDEEGVEDIENLNSVPYWSNDLDHDVDEQEVCVHIGDGDSSDTMIRTSKEDKWENNNS
uniref:Glyoxalase At5g48480-like N-terminal domain-containing protein n=1 Tax=Nelumbo nucifera TaxID=4432 RepID=A0A822Y4A2_NELNU|nr:TPA_asm: hypothetical protein HUJ06_028570 [Nelumbo nucifera]